jgi:hypothetical protein
MTKLTKTLIIIGAVLASIIALPILIKGVVISMATIFAALIIAGVFLLGVFVALAVTSPLWIPFLSGWAAVKYCRSVLKDEKKV